MFGGPTCLIIHRDDPKLDPPNTTFISQLLTCRHHYVEAAPWAYQRGVSTIDSSLTTTDLFDSRSADHNRIINECVLDSMEYLNLIFAYHRRRDYGNTYLQNLTGLSKTRLLHDMDNDGSDYYSREVTHSWKMSISRCKSWCEIVKPHR